MPQLGMLARTRGGEGYIFVRFCFTIDELFLSMPSLRFADVVVQDLTLVFSFSQLVQICFDWGNVVGLITSALLAFLNRRCNLHLSLVCV